VLPIPEQKSSVMAPAVFPGGTVVADDEEIKLRYRAAERHKQWMSAAHQPTMSNQASARRGSACGARKCYRTVSRLFLTYRDASFF
jgi:hypothetical protein